MGEKKTRIGRIARRRSLCPAEHPVTDQTIRQRQAKKHCHDKEDDVQATFSDNKRHVLREPLRSSTGRRSNTCRQFRIKTGCHALGLLNPINLNNSCHEKGAKHYSENNQQTEEV